MVEFWTRQFARNRCAIVRVVVNSEELSDEQKQNAWNHISLGADFDGMINPIDAYIVSDEFKDLRNELKQMLPTMEGFDRLMLGLDIEQILDKVK